MNKKSLLIAAVAILVIAIIGITYLLFTEKQANRELVQEFQLDKEDLENEYTSNVLISRYTVRMLILKRSEICCAFTNEYDCN